MTRRRKQRMDDVDRREGDGDEHALLNDTAPPQLEPSSKRPRLTAKPTTSSPAQAHLTAVFHPRALSSYLELPIELRKYWAGRYDLFSKFDAGISLDAESWYSATHERIAARIAERCRCHTILDAFSGAGGNAIQFAKVCERVVAVEIDPVKVELARHNARIYGVEDRITFVNADISDFAEAHKRARLSRDHMQGSLDGERWHGADRLDFDVVFLSPPWGGPTYIQAKTPPSSLNSRQRREQRRAEARVLAKLAQANLVQDIEPQRESVDIGADAALAVQLGLPLAFEGRLLHGSVEAKGRYDDLEENPAPMPQPTELARTLTATQSVATSGLYPLSRLKPLPGSELFALARSLCANGSAPSADPSSIMMAPTGGLNIALYLPRNVDLAEVAALPRQTRDADLEADAGDVRRHHDFNNGRSKLIHLEECWLRGRLKAVCAYFGELASAWDPVRDGWQT